jgi:hypothetical protein
VTFLLKEHSKKTSVNLLIMLLIIGLLFFSSISSSYELAGKTILAKGIVEATNQSNQEKRKLRRRSNIFDVDNILTGKKSKAQFSMSDGGLITLKENTEIIISEYKFNQKTGEGSATLEVLNGGLRSISGLIKKSGGDYQVKTPGGSIGIRGTHFAVEVVGNDVFFAVYSGNIDVELNNQETLSLGVTEDFAFASINEQGVVTTMTQAPTEISLGYSDNELESISANDSTEDTEDNESISLSTSTEDVALLSGESLSPNIIDSEDENSSLYNESEWQGVTNSPIAELLAERTGTMSYQNISQSSVNSTVGPVSGFNISMTVDFDNASVPGGAFSFSDEQGEWFAAYSGLINIDQMDLGINFASHGNHKADGTIFAGFSNGLDEITGGFNLSEINNVTTSANGSFKIEP